MGVFVYIKYVIVSLIGLLYILVISDPLERQWCGIMAKSKSPIGVDTRPPTISSAADQKRAKDLLIFLSAVTVISLGVLLILLASSDPDYKPTKVNVTIDPDTSGATGSLELSQVASRALADSISLRFDVPEYVNLDAEGLKEDESGTLLMVAGNYVSPKYLPLLALLMGVIGACLHGISSLVAYVGNDDFASRWSIWYVTRPLVGGSLALLVYFVGRAGFVGNWVQTDDFYAILALAGLIGLFSKQALFKLSDIFDVLFQSDKQKVLNDKFTPNPWPVLNSISPDKIFVGTREKMLELHGSGFRKQTVVQVNGETLEPSNRTGEKMTVILPDKFVAEVGTLRINLFSPEPGGGASPAKLLQVVPQDDSSRGDMPGSERPTDAKPPGNPDAHGGVG